MNTYVRFQNHAGLPGHVETIPTPRPNNDVSIDVIGLSRRSRNALVRSGIRTIGALKQKAAVEGGIESLYGIGQKSASEIRKAVAALLAVERGIER